MTARTRTSRTGAATRLRGAREATPPGTSTREAAGSAGIGAGAVITAIAFAVLAALLTLLGPLLPVVRPDHPAAFTAAPMLVVLAILPLLAALVALWRRRPATAFGLLATVALFAPGQLVEDLQLATDVSHSARPELVMPTSLAPLQPSVGLWLLVAGRGCAIVAGVVSVVALRRARAGSGTPTTGDGDVVTRGVLAPQGRITLALCAGLVAATSLLVVAPFDSDDPFLLSRTLLERQGPALAGGLLLVVAAVAAAVGAVGAERWTAVGGTAGTALGLLALALPDVVSGTVVPRLHPTWGPCVMLATVVALAVSAFFMARSARSTGVPAGSRGDRELDLPPVTRLHVAGGLLGTIGGALALVAAFAAQIEVPPTLPPVVGVDRWLLVPAGALVAGLGIAMLLPRVAAIVRPAFVVAATAVPMAAAGGADFVLTATRIDGVRAAAGPWFAGFAVLVVVIAVVCAGLAGGVERDEVDLSTRRLRPVVLCTALLGLGLAVAGFGVPVERAGGYEPPGLWSNFRFASWGMVVVLVTLLVVALVAAFARPSRGVALLLGGAAVLGVHCAELPLTASRAPDTVAGGGQLLSLLGVLALLIAAGFAATGSRRAGVADY